MSENEKPVENNETPAFTEAQAEELRALVMDKSQSVELTFAEMTTCIRGLDLVCRDLIRGTVNMISKMVSNDEDHNATTIAETAAFARETLLLAKQLRDKLQGLCQKVLTDAQTGGIPVVAIIGDHTDTVKLLKESGFVS